MYNLCVKYHPTLLIKELVVVESTNKEFNRINWNKNANYDTTSCSILNFYNCKRWVWQALSLLNYLKWLSISFLELSSSGPRTTQRCSIGAWPLPQNGVAVSIVHPETYINSGVSMRTIEIP